MIQTRFIWMFLALGLTMVVSAQAGKQDVNFKVIESERVETQEMYDAINKANALINAQPKEALD